MVKINKYSTIESILAAFNFGHNIDEDFFIGIDGDNMTLIIPTVKGL